MKNREIIDRGAAAAQSALALLELLDQADFMQCWIKDRSGVIQWANKTLVSQYSDTCNPDDVIGKTDYDLSPKELADHFREDDERVLAGNPIVNREELVTGTDHLVAWFLTTKLPVTNAEGAIIGTIGMTHPKTATPSYQLDPGMPKVLTYIREHYTESLDNSLLALLLGKSEEELVLLFRSQLDMVPQDYVRRVRVRLAIRDLVNAQMTFDEIATKHGFSDQAVFIKEFQAETGITPRAYRLNLFQRGAVRI